MSRKAEFGTSRRDVVRAVGVAVLARSVFGQTDAPKPADSDPLHGLRPAHPRLLLLDADFDRIRLLTRENALAKRLYADLEKECDRLLSIPPVEYRLVGNRLQAQTKRAIARVTSLALMYRLSGRDPWLRRAMLEMNAIAAFHDWNPGRLIDTADLTHAFSLGYDWLFNALSAEERATVRDAILSKGLDPALAVYQKPGAWSRERAHWNPVCNASFAMGALAVADDVPDKAAQVLRGALESIGHGVQNFTAEGAWPDGPANGEYALRYVCLLAGSLNTAVGNANESALTGARGFDRTARALVYMTGAANRISNFGGAPEDPGTAPELFWLSRRFSSPVAAWFEQREIERGDAVAPNPLDLAWFERDARLPQSPQWPLDAVFHSVQTASFRSSWDDPNAIFFAVKGGDNKGLRPHLDLGAFVLDAGGIRWAVDPEPTDLVQGAPPPTVGGRSNPPQSQPAPSVAPLGRGQLQPNQSANAVAPPAFAWQFRTEAHNTLLVDEANQDVRAEAAVVRQDLGPDLSWVQIDLSRSNGPKLKQWTRRAGLVQRQAVLIQDFLQAAQPVEVLWGMLTEAEIVLNGSSATLRHNGWNLAVDIRTPRHAVFDTVIVGPASRKLVVRLGDKVSDLDLRILLTPYRDGQPKPKINLVFPELAAVPGRLAPG